MSKARQMAMSAAMGTMLPVGTISYFPTASIPQGWLIANGDAVSRATYADLFAAIGTTYGAGNGTTTFNLPDGRGRSLIGAGQGPGLTNRALAATGGAETHELTEAQMPLHGHPVRMNYVSGGSSQTSGGLIVNANSNSGTQPAYTGSPSNTQGQQIGGAGGGQAHNNMQPFLSVNMCIYAGG